MPEDLISKIKGGNETAFKSLFEQYYQSLAYFSFKYVQNKELAEDIVQDIFIKIWTNRASLDSELNLGAYLYRAVKNASLNALKSQKVRQEYLAAQDLQQVVDQFIPNEIDASDLKLVIESALTSLPAERQKIFRLSRESGLKYGEIATKLGISVKTVEAQMGKALQHMRKMLQDFMLLLPALFFY